MKKVLCCLFFAFTSFFACATTYDFSLADFPRKDDETSDSPRIQRAVDSTKSGVLFVPRGEYLIDKRVDVSNGASLDLHKSAKFKAVKNVDCMFSFIAPKGVKCTFDHSMFLKGGVFDGNGLADVCVKLFNFKHFTMEKSLIRNPIKYGLHVEKGYEYFVSNVYFRCDKSGLAGNVGVYIEAGDSHYTDIVVIDYTVGMKTVRGGANRYTRCHIWGGPLPPVKDGEPREMLKNSICFDNSGGEAIFRDCYADTGMIGYKINATTRLLGCSYFNNYKTFKMDNPLVIEHNNGVLLVDNCHFRKNSPNSTLYNSTNPKNQLIWRDNLLSGFKKSPIEER